MESVADYMISEDLRKRERVQMKSSQSVNIDKIIPYNVTELL
jgi:hypothetical protein